MSGLTLTFVEPDRDPNCHLIFGAGSRNLETGEKHDRRVELTFAGAAYVRAGPKSDEHGVESIGYTVEGAFDGSFADYSDWFEDEWMRLGVCPDSGFYVAIESDWLHQTGKTGGAYHYVIAGRDGFVEVLARGYAWREWEWIKRERDANSAEIDVVRVGEGREE